MLVDAHTVEVTLVGGGTRRLKAKHILIATGGVVTKLKIPGAVSQMGRQLFLVVHLL